MKLATAPGNALPAHFPSCSAPSRAQVRDLELEADGKQLLAGPGTTFRLRPGDWALLTGPEGAGKSTVLPSPATHSILASLKAGYFRYFTY